MASHQDPEAAHTGISHPPRPARAPLCEPPAGASPPEHASGDQGRPELHHLLPVQQAAPAPRRPLRRGARAAAQEEVRRPLVPGAAPQGLGLPLRAHRGDGGPRGGAGGQAQRPGRGRGAGQRARGAQRLDRPLRGLLPDRGEGLRQGPLPGRQRGRRGRGGRRGRRAGQGDPQQLQPRRAGLRAHRQPGQLPVQLAVPVPGPLPQPHLHPPLGPAHHLHHGRLRRHQVWLDQDEEGRRGRGGAAAPSPAAPPGPVPHRHPAEAEGPLPVYAFSELHRGRPGPPVPALPQCQGIRVQRGLPQPLL
ncbi:protein Tob2 isoform X3 [Monodelphis domestica]|uniref:protein Tob2 isoform X3 n=1 Tax=Monodelphis domestica TaxID=13616 RepID=UPI0024E1FA67|nr:protein Tob2 isoform X3 [Monodelphis domestica]